MEEIAKPAESDNGSKEIIERLRLLEEQNKTYKEQASKYDDEKKERESIQGKLDAELKEKARNAPYVAAMKRKETEETKLRLEAALSAMKRQYDDMEEMTKKEEDAEKKKANEGLSSHYKELMNGVKDLQSKDEFDLTPEQNTTLKSFAHMSDYYGRQEKRIADLQAQVQGTEKKQRTMGEIIGQDTQRYYKGKSVLDNVQAPDVGGVRPQEHGLLETMQSLYSANKGQNSYNGGFSSMPVHTLGQWNP
jgi:hypothetical protein